MVVWFVHLAVALVSHTYLCFMCIRIRIHIRTFCSKHSFAGYKRERAFYTAWMCVVSAYASILDDVFCFFFRFTFRTHRDTRNYGNCIYLNDADGDNSNNNTQTVVNRLKFVNGNYNGSYFHMQ